MADLERLLQEYEGRLDHIDLCAAIKTLPYLPPGPQRLQLAQTLTEWLRLSGSGLGGQPLMDAKGQADVLWAWAKIKYWPHPHFMNLLSTFTANTKGVGTFELTNAAWTLNQAWQAWHGHPQPWHPSRQQVQQHMQLLQAACLPVLQDMNFQDVSNLLLAAQGTGVLDDGLAQGLLLHIRQLLSPGAPRFKPQALSNSLWSLAKLERPGCQELLRDAAKAVVQSGCMHGDTPQAWSNLMWAFATLGHPDSLELCRYVAGQVVQHDCMRGSTPQNWANLLWAFATLGHPDSLELCQYVAHQVAQHDCMIHGVTPQNWSNLMWAVATLGHPDSLELCVYVARKVVQHDCMRGAMPQAWSNLVWAFATLGHPDSLELCRYVAQQVVQHDCMRGGKPQDWSNLAWAFATLGHPDSQELCRYVAGQVVQHNCMGGATPQGWSNLLWAFATLGHPGSLELCTYVAQMVVQHDCMRGGPPQALSNLVWAFATLRHPDSLELCMYVAGQVVQHDCMRGAKPQAWSNLVWALAKLRHYEDGGAVFERVIVACPALLRDMRTQEMSNSLYACATVYHKDGMGQLLDDMLPHILAKRGQFNWQDLANSCWSLAVLGLSSHPALESLMQEANSRLRQPGHCGHDGLRQLWQAHLELQDQGLGHLGLSGQLQVEAQAAWEGRGAEFAGHSESYFQQQVAAALRELEPHSVVEVGGTTRCGMFAVDMLVTRPGQTLPLALEVDGPSHFLRSLPPRYDGNTQLRNRQLGRLQLRGLSGLVLMTHHEWDNKSPRAHLELLRGKLAWAVRGQGGATEAAPV